ncbi:hypothetical protein GZL_02591 [Streptomyces sp. 769]|nr:hypothetical protein GZL_02591 [Streptomyces sp. 769]
MHPSVLLGQRGSRTSLVRASRRGRAAGRASGTVWQQGSPDRRGGARGPGPAGPRPPRP